MDKHLSGGEVWFSAGIDEFFEICGFQGIK